MREIRHDLIPANAIDSHESEPLKLHDLIQFLLDPALPNACIFPSGDNTIGIYPRQELCIMLSLLMLSKASG